MKKFINVLKEKGIVKTPQRMAVWNFLCGNKGHPCAETIYDVIRKDFPTISFATVYTILEIFKNIGIVQELYIRKDKICFDPFVSPHHHFLCSRCNRIYDIAMDCRTACMKEIDGHNIGTMHGYFHGICRKCKRR